MRRERGRAPWSALLGAPGITAVPRMMPAAVAMCRSGGEHVRMDGKEQGWRWSGAWQEGLQEVAPFGKIGPVQSEMPRSGHRMASECSICMLYGGRPG